MISNAPKNIAELWQAAQQLAGKSLGSLAAESGFLLPDNPQAAKGCIGQLLECVLGADAGTKPVPDFQHLGVELKTVPINQRGSPAESTFVCRIPLLTIHQEIWEKSTVYQKLRHVLWVPVEGDTSIALVSRRVGLPVLWQPSQSQAQQLQQDWQMLVDKIALGELESIASTHGKYLQIRPKAAHGKVLCKAYGAEGTKIQTLPRGFYLRTTFTRQVLS